LPKITPPQFANHDGLNATSDDENADILKNNHFEAVFDRRDLTTDETVIHEIEELDIDGDLKEELRSIPEIEEAKKTNQQDETRDITRNNGSNVRYAQGATRESTGALDLDYPEILEMRRGSRSVAHHASDGLIKGKIQDQRPKQLEGCLL
jgi:hypothetical protein